jgi:hypothetical protein
VTVTRARSSVRGLAAVSWRSTAGDVPFRYRFARDSPLEEAGFELAVPRRIVTLILVFAYVTPSK